LERNQPVPPSQAVGTGTRNKIFLQYFIKDFESEFAIKAGKPF